MADLQKLITLMRDSNLTMGEIAQKSGLALSTVCRYFKGSIKVIRDDSYNAIYTVVAEKTVIKLNENQLSHNDKNDVVEKKDDVVVVDTATLKNQMMKNGINNDSIHNYRAPKRGDIWYVKNGYATGNEQWGSRPAIIVSNNKVFEATGTVEICYLTSKPKYAVPTHTNIHTTDRGVSIVLGEQICSVSRDRLDKYYSKITDEEMMLVENSLMISLGIRFTQKEKIIEVPNNNMPIEYSIIKNENKMLLDFQEKLLKILMK